MQVFVRVCVCECLNGDSPTGELLGPQPVSLLRAVRARASASMATICARSHARNQIAANSCTGSGSSRMGVRTHTHARAHKHTMRMRASARAGATKTISRFLPPPRATRRVLAATSYFLIIIITITIISSGSSSTSGGGGGDITIAVVV